MSIKSAFLIISMFPVLSFGAITPTQVDQARKANRTILDASNEMQTFIQAVYAVVINGNVYQTDFSTNTVALTAAQKQDIVDRYQILKAKIQDAVNNLP